MKKIVILTAILCCGLISFAQERVVLYNATIVDVEKGVLVPSMTIVMENGLLTTIEKARKKIRKGEIDVTNKYIMPGMIDSHLHWANFAGERPEMDSLSNSYLREGVTTVRDVGGDALVLQKYMNYLKSDSLSGPAVYYSSFWAGKNYFDMRGREESVEVAWNREINPSDDYEKAILAAKECGCLGLKLYADLTYEQLVEIVALCKKHGIKPWGHLASNEENALEVVRAGVEVVSHIYYVNNMLEAGKGTMEELFGEMKKRGTVLDPTLTISLENGMDYVVPHFIAAYQAGVQFVAGTDYIDISDQGSYKSFFLHEMDLYVDKCGVSPLDAIRAATINGAEILGKKDQLGVIKKGAEADLLVLSKNPLESIKALREIEMLYIDGKRISQN